MKSVIWLGVGVAVTLALVSGALWVGLRLASGGGRFASPSTMLGYGVGGRVSACSSSGDLQMGRRATGPGTVDEEASCAPEGGVALSGEGAVLTTEGALKAFKAYLADADLATLRLTEVMEFRHNYYAVATDPETDMGAMELMLDKATGVVGPEVGPNMMWNVAYGMHRGPAMMGPQSAQLGTEHKLSTASAIERAQAWLASHHTGEAAAAHADVFPGYFTIHTVDSAGEIVGMLSVHAETGQVWYHTWHGDFVRFVSWEADLH